MLGRLMAVFLRNRELERAILFDSTGLIEAREFHRYRTTRGRVGMRSALVDLGWISRLVATLERRTAMPAGMKPARRRKPESFALGLTLSQSLAGKS